MVVMFDIGPNLLSVCQGAAALIIAIFLIFIWVRAAS